MPSVLRENEQGNAFVPCIIDGSPVQEPTDYFPVISAQKQEIVHYGQSANVTIATKAVNSSWEAFLAYKETPIHERRRLLLKAAELFDERIEDGMNRQMIETSCDKTWSAMTSKVISTVCRELAGAFESALIGEVRPSYYGHHNLVVKEPIGPILTIIPWNGPLILCVRAIATALAAGCTVLLKASELCPWTHQFAVETFLDAGFPPGSVNMVMADRPDAAQVTETIIAHPRLRKVEFVGSPVIARSIGALAAKYLKPTLMELGDQSPAVVLDDADLANAAKLCVQGAMLNHGQVCVSTERIIVQSSIKDEFTRLLTAEIEKYPTAGFAVSNASAEKAKAVVDDAISRGAKLLAGSNSMTAPASLSPSILTDVDPQSIISKQEGWAPTAFVVCVDDDDSAVAEANSREGGLSASVFTRNWERGLELARKLEFGMVQINNLTIAAEGK
ncbi:aldehyde dehydrogenase [Fusarium albosuccineum]|uniref:Aldehyde dehydrogenase n=1 Tax=Fusarium albosuccineum TaxID=1237068 RepID=A0A8H4LG75_9HYPO|nr:aldehyde dehydrogenase [Fusarium albosuccineum]